MLPALAVLEIDHEVDYYESRQPGLGAELEDELEAVFATILQFPQAAPQWKNRVDRRVAVLDRFPFTLWGALLSRRWRALTASQLSYGDPAGYAPLREAIAARVVRVAGEEIRVTRPPGALQRLVFFVLGPLARARGDATAHPA